MTQKQMDLEREEKERAGMKHADVKSPDAVEIRVFADGTGYALGGFGGRYVKFAATGV